MSLRQKIGKIKRLKNIPKSFLFDCFNRTTSFYENSSAALNENNIELICRELRILTHTIEKGLSLPVIKDGFGKEKIKTILSLLDKFIEIGNFEYDADAFYNGVAIVDRYMNEAPKHNCDISYINLDKYKKYGETDIKYFGVQYFDSKKFQKVKNINFEQLAHLRHSIRYFSDKALSEEIIDAAIELANTAPSACNRQDVRIIHVKDKNLCKRIMDIQGGCKGHSITELLLVASDLRLYRYTSEICTPYLDCGIFIMNLLYSFTYYGISTCPLIWDDYGEKGKLIRDYIHIPNYLHIVALIQIGFYPEENGKYAISHRSKLKHILFDADQFNQ